MTITLQWYERREDFTPNYDRTHHGTVHGATAAECMGKINEYRRTHDLARYTPTEIVCVAD